MDLQDYTAEPQRLGFNSDGLKRAEDVLKRGLEDGLYPAAVFLVLRDGKVAAGGALGTPQPHRQAPTATQLTTIFDMASLTKPITATLLLQCAERGELHLGMRVADFLPEAFNSPAGALSLLHLATHTSGLPAWKPLYTTERASAVEEILATQVEAEPGVRYAYSDLGYILIGEILARVTSVSLDQLACERIFEPLGMAQSGFCPDESRHDTIAATANCPWREGQILVGEVHDANAYSMRGVAGHAGLFSSAPDMARFAVSLCHPEEVARLGLPPVLKPLASRLAMIRQTDPAVGGHSIGWFTVPNGMLPLGDLFSQQTFGHTGFTGTLLLHDPACAVTILLLTNRVYAPGDGAGLLRLRRLFANAVAGAIGGGSPFEQTQRPV